MHRSHIQTVFFFSLLIGVLLLAFFIFLPYLTTLSVAATFAVATFPLHRWLIRRLRGKETVAALLTIVITVLLVLTPLTLIGTQVAVESQNLYQRITENQTNIMEVVTNAVEGYLDRFAPQLSIDLDKAAEQGIGWLAAKIGPIFSETAQSFLHLFLGLIAFYYFLKDGRKFLSALIDLSPLADGDDVKILHRLSIAINSIIRGTLTIALLQGVLTGIGLTIFGVPSPTLWGSLAAMGALVPGIGTGMVILPAVLYLFLIGKTGGAVGMLIWGIVAVGLIDNFLGPILVGRGVRIHPLFILFSVIGGIGFFGPLGFLLGPLVLSLLFALLDIYRLLMADKKSPVTH